MIASRYTKGSRASFQLKRKIISSLSVFLVRLLLPKARKVKDPISEFFAFKRKVIEGIELNPSRLKILLEVLMKGNYNGVVEVPFSFRPRKRGKSKSGLMDGINYLWHIVKLIFKTPPW